MKDTTVVLTISHEGELPKGLLAALEAKAYDFTMAKGVACGDVVAKEGNEAEMVCAEAYQVVGSLLSDIGQFNTKRAVKILDNLCNAKLMHADVLLWPSFLVRLPVKEMRHE
jgi:hypothetical protein